MPSRRHGHASWAYDGKVYIFGGISLARYPELGTTEVLHERVLSDLWCFDPAREAWTQLEPAGSRPCARALMGAALAVPRAVYPHASLPRADGLF
jgi:N-acetylneuraminic acid mutarotase